MRSGLFIFIAISSLFFSCENAYFSSPQPVDSKNVLSFPQKFRGAWAVEGDTIIIEKKFFRYIRNNKDSVSLEEADSAYYLLKDNKIYHLDLDERTLSPGFPYSILNDTIFYRDVAIVDIDLGKNAFLRKVKEVYILNYKQENQWWELYLFQKDKQGEIVINRIDLRKLEKFSNYVRLHSFEREYSRSDYLEANWTKKEILEMLDQGVFSDTLLALKPKDKIRLKPLL